jgi:hypothetical protein
MSDKKEIIQTSESSYSFTVRFVPGKPPNIISDGKWVPVKDSNAVDVHTWGGTTRMQS